jgi:hypothetical protein
MAKKFANTAFAIFARWLRSRRRNGFKGRHIDEDNGN